MINQIGLFFQKHITLLEKYILAPNRQAVFDVSNEEDKKILKLITQLNSKEDKQIMKELGLSPSLQKEIYQSKLLRDIGKVDNQNRQKVINEIKEMLRLEFNHIKPVDLGPQKGADKKQKQNVKSEFETELTVTDVVNSSLSNNAKNISNLTVYGLKNIDKTHQNILFERQNMARLFQQRNLILSLSNEQILKFIEILFSEMNESDKKQLPIQFYQFLTINQIQYLRSQRSEWFQSATYYTYLFQKLYAKKLSSYKPIDNMEHSELQDKKKLLLEIKTYLNEAKHQFYFSFKKQINEELLLVGEALKDCDEDLLVEYLNQIQIVDFDHFTDSYKQSKSGFKQNQYLAPFQYLSSSSINKKELIERVIKSLFERQNYDLTRSKLEPYIKRKILYRYQYQAMLAKGDKVDAKDLNEMFTIQQLNDLKDKKQITLLKKNCKVYSAKDQIKLYIRIKNITSLELKIYSIDLQKQYLTLQEEISHDINLRYLIPRLTRIISFSDQKIDPYLEIQTQIKLSELDDQAGLFIAQLEGEGVSSRAIIRKGSIFCENIQTESGHELKFYDQNGNQIKDLWVWNNGVRKEVTVEKPYKIPYGNSRTETIIAVNGSCASLEQVKINSEDYTFKVSYIYHSESFLVGGTGRMILHPTLSLRDTPINLNRLSKTVIKIGTINNQNISSLVTIDNAEFKDGQDYILEFPIKSYLKEINISIQTEIKLINKQVRKLISNKTVVIDLQESTNNFVDIYLARLSDGKHQIQVRGKNGQGIPDANIQLSYIQYGSNEAFVKQLNADQKGNLNLGRLPQVKKLTALATTGEFKSSRTWSIHDYSESVSYGSTKNSTDYQLNMIAGETFKIPVPYQIDINSEIIFTHKNEEGNLSSNEINNLKLINQSLVAENLKVGHYCLQLLRLQKQINLTVIPAKKWHQNTNKVKHETKGFIYDIAKNEDHFVTLGDIKANIVNDQVQYSIDLVIPQGKDIPKDLRIHVFGQNYSDADDNRLYQCQQSIKIDKTKSLLFEKQQTVCYSNKTLSDETAYVLNRRKNMEPAVGNNLQKPHLFLKRQMVRETAVKEEKLQKQMNYLQSSKMAKHAPMRQMACKSAMRMDDMAFGDSMGAAKYRRMAMTIKRNHNSHNNFLSQSGYLDKNLKNVTQLKLPKGYNQIVVYLMTNKSSVKREYALPGGEITTIKQSHPLVADKDQNTGLAMSRQFYELRKGQKREISRNSTWNAVSLANIVEYAKIQGANLPNWILGWRGYSQEKKSQEYDKYWCHQMNIYLKRNDPIFFEKIVKPFIRNKIVKTFVDYYLTDDKQVLKYSAANMIGKLNSFEQALLAEQLAKNGHRKQAETIVNSLKYSIMSKKRSFEQYRRRFDTVLNAKKEEQNVNQQKPNSFGGSFAFGSMGAPPPPMNAAFSMAYSAPPPPAGSFDLLSMDEGKFSNQQFEKAQQQYKTGFKQTQKTKQYTETTYENIKNEQQSARLITPNEFWADFATHLISSNPSSDFLSINFLYLEKRIEFVLACSLISNEPNAIFEINSKNDIYEIKADSSFLIFIKEVKVLPYEKNRKQLVINQRFFDPTNRFVFEDDGTKTQKQIDQFLVRKIYTVQTIVTNISSSNQEVQLLIDIPEGAIPLRSHQHTQIISINLGSFSTQSFERQFYFPSAGNFSFYPANTCRGKTIISKGSTVPNLIVRETESKSNNLQTLDNILRGGSDEDILNYIQNRNIFDGNIFDVYAILWKLKDQKFYSKLVNILKNRFYYNSLVWSYAFYHNDYELVCEYLAATNSQKATLQPVLEYFPYYSSRSHKFVDQTKSTIRVEQFRDNYSLFLYQGIFNHSLDKSYFNLTLIYYLIIQDRLHEVREFMKRISVQEKSKHQLQYDYIDCYLNLCEGGQDYNLAKGISQKYLDYGIPRWRKLFADVQKSFILNEIEQNEESTKGEAVYQTLVVNQGKQIKLDVPEGTRVIVNIYAIDLELYFSEQPFDQIKNLSVMKPTECKQFESGNFRIQRLRRDAISTKGDMIVEVYQYQQGKAGRKVTSFFWANPALKIKMNENAGTLNVYFDNKRCQSSYCKVYSRNGSNSHKFYRDGYTDISGAFRYALDVTNITEFAILVATENGGIIQKVKPPLSL